MSVETVRYIGGELPLPRERIPTTFLLHSGRAAIRTFCRNFPGKKILLPDFLCYIIVDLLEEEGAPYDFYHVNEDLTIDLGTVENRDFDALFVIDYYGMRHDELRSLDLDRFILLQDSVFDLSVRNYLDAPRWFAFNSLRKVTHLADGSILHTNLPIENPAQEGITDFSTAKYAAKDLKSRFFHMGEGSETAYLEALQEAEKRLDAETGIRKISDTGLALLLELLENREEELTARRANFACLKERLGDLWIGAEGEFPSFFVIKTDRRDALRHFLFEHRIFLPVHWPHFGVENPLFGQVLSIPVFGHYTLEDMTYVADKIEAFLSRKEVQ